MSKSLIITLLLALCFFKQVNAQFAYYDALTLSRHVTADSLLDRSSDSVFMILDKYVQPTVNNTKQQIIEKINGGSKGDPNPFLEISGGTESAGDRAQPIKSLLSKGLSSVGGLDVTNFADGLAKFLVERTKKELSISFFERFKKDMEDIKQLQILFPASYRALQAIDKEIYNYAAYIELLRESFQKDLALLLPDIGRLVDDPCMDAIFKTYPEVRTILSDGLYIVNAFSDGTHPGEVIHLYVSEKIDSVNLTQIDKSIYPSLRTLDLFSQSLRAQNTTQYWVNGDAIKKLFKNEITLRIYFGLIYQQALNEKIYFDKVSLAKTLADLVTKFDALKKQYQPFLLGLVDRGKTVDSYFQAIKKLQAEGKDKPTYQDYYSLFDASLNFLEYLTQAKTIFNLPALNKYDKKIDKYFTTARSLGNIYVDVHEKQYTSAIVELGSVYKLLVTKEYSDLKDSLEIKTTDAKKTEIKNRLSQLSFLDAQEKLVPLIIKYGGFAAEMTKAETSDDVQKAIEAFALPAGSARVKRESSFNVSLNAYTGIYAGYERIKGVDRAYSFRKPFDQWNSFGITAPVGVAVSFGHRKFFWQGDGHWSYSLFVSLIDIGTIASFRFNSPDSVTQIPKVQLKDIVSPGVFFSVGIPKTPLSINLGTQMGANIRKVNASTPTNPDPANEYANKVYWRYSISICVDIPLLNFYTKSQ